MALHHPLRRLLLVAALLVPGAAPASAEAAVVYRAPGDLLVFEAARYEANRVTIRYDTASRTYSVRDAGVSELGTFGGSRGCDSAADPRMATCSAEPGDTVFVSLEDGDDVLELQTPRLSGICGGEGDDVVRAGDGPDVIWGEEGDDELSGGAGIDTLAGEEVCHGDGEITAPPGEDRLRGGPGNDTLEAGRGDDELDGEEGDDRLFAYAGDDELVGGDGDDLLSGDDGDDDLRGEDGKDALCGGHGADTESGGAGDDVLAVSLTSQRFGCDDAGDDTLDAGPGDDELVAGPTTGFFAEHTELPLPGPTEAGNGADRFIGGTGSDTLTFAGRLTAVSASVNGVADDGAAGEGDDVGAGIEHIVGGAADDTLTGGAGADRLDGAGGADVLRGGDGDDTLLGGAVDAGVDRIFGEGGRDTLRGGAGPDELDGGAEADTVAGEGGDDGLRGGDGEDDLTGGPGSDRADGGAGDDRLVGADPRQVGADGGDALAGGPGNDTLAGGPGDDELLGGLGADHLSGGDDADLADYSDARSAVSVTFDGIADDGRGGERDNVLPDIEGFRGGREDDTVRGGTLLGGGDGEDYLDGGTAVDRLRGGAGGDTLRSRDGAADRVSCGRGLDLAVADAVDQVASDCELVSVGAASARAGRRAIVRPAAGAVELGHAGAHRTAPLLDRISVPLPVRLDATRGAVEVVAARRGRRVRARLSGAAFALRQRGVPTARVLASRTACPGRPAGTLVARLRATSSRLLRTSGAAGSAQGRGRWVTEERCNGTRFRVTRGAVRVHDRLDRRVLTLRAGGSHLARLP